MTESKTYTKQDNLPTLLSAFIGREREIADVKQLLKANRLVTITGPGGAGKTRLSLQAGNELRTEYKDGIWFAQLASLLDETLVTQTIASCLNVREQSGQLLIDTLADHLFSRQILLIIDNCEHLIQACAQFAETILQRCPKLRILATSRERLGIAGELAWSIPPLTLPSDQPWKSPASAQNALDDYMRSEAVQLFVNRASAVVRDFALNTENGAWISTICRRLEGMPLAIELAAARVRALSVQQIAERLNDSFQLLTHGARNLPQRQQTIRDTIDWSYELLNRAEQVLFVRLGVFVGGWTLEAAEAICSEGLSVDVLSGMESLLDKSLLPQARELHGKSRFMMLEAIREYASEKLSATHEVRNLQRQHAEYFALWINQMAKELRAGSTQLSRFEQLEAEQGNISAALEWSLGGEDSELGLKMISTLFDFWWRAGHWMEWERWMARVPALIDHVTEATRAGTLVALSALATYVKRDTDSTIRYSSEALQIFRRLGDRRNMAWAIFWLNTGSGHLLGDDKEYARVIASTEEAITLLKQENDLASIAQGFTNLGEYEYRHGDLVRAKAAYQEALEIARQIKDELREHINYSNLGDLAVEEGEYETAMTLFKRSLLWSVGRENLPMILIGLSSLAIFWSRQSQHKRFARLHGAGGMLSEKWGVKLQPIGQSYYDRYVLLTRQELGDQVFLALSAEGRAMSLEQAIEYALEPVSPKEVEKALDGLTARELEVVILISQGKSNREIAKGMTIGVKTVETYVTRVLNKLRFNSRVQIATWAIEKGLALSNKPSN